MKLIPPLRNLMLMKLQMTNCGVLNHFRMIATVNHALKKHGMQDFNARHIKIRIMDFTALGKVAHVK